MERITELLEAMEPVSKERFDLSRSRVLTEYGSRKVVIQEGICRSFAEAFRKAVSMQEKGGKNPICFTAVIRLDSSYLTGSFRYHISLYDRTFYLDRREACADYTPDHIAPYFRDDMDFLIKETKKRFIRLKNYEAGRLLLMHAGHYHGLVQEILEDTAPDIKNLAEYRKLKKTEDHVFLFGGCQDKAVILRTAGQETEAVPAR